MREEAQPFPENADEIMKRLKRRRQHENMLVFRRTFKADATEKTMPAEAGRCWWCAEAASQFVEERGVA